MVNTVVAFQDHFLRHLLKLTAGTRPEQVVIEQGTVINFWVPTKPKLPTKPPLVFLHGFGFNGILTWQFQVLAFSNTHSVYVPDLLFFGSSFTDSPNRTPKFQAECLGKALKKLGVEKECTVVGFSYGGVLAFRMAEMFPEMVRAVVVTGLGMELTESISRVGLERLGYGSWKECLVPDNVEGMKKLLQVASVKKIWLPACILNHAFEVALVKHRKERVELLEALVIADNDFKIRSYTQVRLQKIHFIWGENDQMMAVEVARQQVIRLLNGKAKLDSIERAGHLVQMERPFTFNKSLKIFLNSLDEVNIPQE
ncbi:hypothetical protein LINPERPRIM_LOCUS39237 [Linum perenne]